MGSRARCPIAVTMTLAIGPATVHDLASVAAIERAAFSDPWSLRSFREALDSASVYFACARSDAGSVLGYVVAWFVADQGEIANIAVAPDCRGGASDARCWTRRSARRRPEGSPPCFWRCATRINARASCMRREDSRKWGVVERYYRRPVEDAIVLRRTLSLAGV